LTDRDFWEAVICALLMLIDAVERWQGIAPRTKEYRDEGRRALRRKG